MCRLDGCNSNWLYPWFISRRVNLVAPFSLYRNSSRVGITCIVRLIARLAVVMSMFIRISLGSAFGVMTMLDSQSVGPSASSVIWLLSSSSSRVSNLSCLAKGIFLWSWMTGGTDSSMCKVICQYLCLPIP